MLNKVQKGRERRCAGSCALCPLYLPLCHTETKTYKKKVKNILDLYRRHQRLGPDLTHRLRLPTAVPGARLHPRAAEIREQVLVLRLQQGSHDLGRRVASGAAPTCHDVRSPQGCWCPMALHPRCALGLGELSKAWQFPPT